MTIKLTKELPTKCHSPKILEATTLELLLIQGQGKTFKRVIRTDGRWIGELL